MFEEIANHLWQSTLFATVIAGLCFLLRHQGAHIRYRLWWIASAKFLVPFSWLTALGSWLVVRTGELVPETMTNTVNVVANPFAADGASWSWSGLMLGSWATGSVLIGLSWALRAGRLRRTLRAAVPDAEPLVDGDRRIRVARTAEHMEPGVVGVLRSVLLLPEGLERNLSPHKLETVIAHELCHIRRRDNLTAAVHMLVEILFWFHPLVWWIGAQLIDERERACDEMVVARGHDRATYAESILDVCERYVASPLPCAAGISGSDLKRRITQIMRFEGVTAMSLGNKCVLSAVAAAVLVLPVLAGFSAQGIAHAQDAAAAASAEPAPASSVEQAETVDSEAEPADEYLPIVTVPPVYPPRAAARGLEGYVVVEYTVTATGTIEDVEIVESSAMLFERAAVDSVRQFEYRPKIENGTAVPVPGVRSRIEFVLRPRETDDGSSG